MALSVCMAKSGYPEHALATLLAFDTYLRISEYVNMRVEDVAVPGDPRMGGVSMGENPPTVADFDCVFSDYIDGVYEGGGSYGAMLHTYHGLIFFCPFLKYHMPEADVRLRGWKNQHPPESQAPLTWEVTVTLSV